MMNMIKGLAFGGYKCSCGYKTNNRPIFEAHVRGCMG